MSPKFFTISFLLAISVFGYAQDERNTVLYAASRDSGKKNFWRGSLVVTTTVREAQLEFTPENMLFVSREKTDTIPFAKIDQIARDTFIKRTFTFTFSNRKGFVAMRFCKKKNAREFIDLLIEKKVNYKHPKLISQILWGLLVPFIGGTAMPGIDTKYKWRMKCE